MIVYNSLGKRLIWSLRHNLIICRTISTANSYNLEIVVVWTQRIVKAADFSHISDVIRCRSSRSVIVHASELNINSSSYILIALRGSLIMNKGVIIPGNTSHAIPDWSVLLPCSLVVYPSHSSFLPGLPWPILVFFRPWRY